jgi:hypothetical protein
MNPKKASKSGTDEADKKKRILVRKMNNGAGT